ncbi:hypothetical protein ACFVYG_06585 [Streptomyces sp. NPDC058256]|uniref:hypothetical protein n=1 Tax=Streptomyces sp. NPDC058256 TaxID=3346408 RepID=UPI0036F1704A
MYAVRLHAAEAAVTVLSADRAVTDWCARYVRPWWDAFEVPADQKHTVPIVVARVDPGRYAEEAAAVCNDPHTVTTRYARADTLVSRNDDGVITAVSPGLSLAYRSEPATGRVTVCGTDTEPVAAATARIAREAARGVLLRAGWAVLHASAVALDQEVILMLGGKGEGKTTAALTLADRHGWELLANDRVFVRPAVNGVWVMPWPSAAALGLGLLDALGWYDSARERLLAGQALHPTQDQRVTVALMAGRRTPVREGKRELKAQVFPDQFPAWFGVGLASGGRAVSLLFPRVRPGASPALTENGRTLADADFMSGATEDRYPDVFCLLGVDGGGLAEARKQVTERLGFLPHHAVVLGHDVDANADVLLQAAAGA